jgi:hypothetical protein
MEPELARRLGRSPRIPAVSAVFFIHGRLLSSTDRVI